ncbi:MAG: hypothetical protein ACOCY6_05830 [Halodesulfurarchaeum sp.]
MKQPTSDGRTTNDTAESIEDDHLGDVEEEGVRGGLAAPRRAAQGRLAIETILK